jgi:NADH:ubiquinone oxidoreductase subunit 6 (subunit J)
VIYILLIFATVIFAVIAVEMKRLLYAVVSLGGMSITIGILFALLNSFYVMAFQFLIYAGAMMALFLSVVMLTERGEK